MTERLRPDLREFQEEDLPWFMANAKSFMLYEPRLGKTVMSANIVMLDDRIDTVLVVASKNALFTWRDHMLVWNKKLCPSKTVEVRIIRGITGSGAKAIRHAFWKKPRTADKTIFICTYGILHQDFNFLQLPSTRNAVQFSCVIGDEVHLRMKNRKTKTNTYFKAFVTNPRCVRFHALSGTMTSKGGPLDFWPILNMIEPKRFGSYWNFANSFTEWVSTNWGREIIGPKNLVQFWRLMSGYAKIRRRVDVAPQMPKIQRQLLKVEPTTEQLDIWYKLQEDGFMFNEVNGDMVVAATSLEKVLRVRQLMTCPKILGESFGVGALLEHIVDRLDDEEISVTPLDKQIVIFTAFAKALPHFQKYLNERGYHNVFTLRGGIEPEEQEQQIKLWRQTQGIMLCTVKYAQAFSLTPAEQCFFIGYEWDPNDNKQAEDRLVGQEGGGIIDSYYGSLIGMDENFAESLNIKSRLISLTLGTTKNFKPGELSKKSLRQ